MCVHRETFGNKRRADGATGTRFVLDDQGFASGLSEPGCQKAREEILR
jgi:hypothetical protein